MRKEFPATVRVKAWQRADGRCEECTRKLYPGDVRFDHQNPDGLTGEPTLENCQVLCRSCHDVKTFRRDNPAIAEAKRRERIHLGVKKPPKRRWGYGKGDKYRKKLDGRVVPR